VNFGVAVDAIEAAVPLFQGKHPVGFVTGYNAAASDPEKQVQLDPAAVDLYVRKWCTFNPTSNIFTAVLKLLDRTDP
jgi:hypothetical protein